MCTSTCSLVTLTALKTLVCTSTPVHRHVHLHSKYSNCVVATRQQQLFKTIVCQLCWRGNSRGNPQQLLATIARQLCWRGEFQGESPGTVLAILFFLLLPSSLSLLSLPPSPFLPPSTSPGQRWWMWCVAAHFRKVMAACEREKKSSSIRASKKCQTGKRGSTGRRSLSH